MSTLPNAKPSLLNPMKTASVSIRFFGTQKGVRYKYVTFRLSACSTLDRLTIFSLLFGIPLYRLPQGTNNQVINVTYLYLTPFCRQRKKLGKGCNRCQNPAS